MTLKLSNLNPIRIIHQMDQRFPQFKTFREDPKVQKVAGRIFKALACIVFGGMIGAITFSTLGSGLFLIGLGAGAGFGALTYLGVESVFITLNKYGFPAHKYKTIPPMPIERWLSDKKHRIFKQTFLDKITPLEYYEEWKELHQISSDSKAEKRLWKEFQKGTCEGEAQTLISLLKKNHSLPSGNLLGEIKAKDLFRRQMLEIIRADLFDHEGAEEKAHDLRHAEPLMHKSYTKAEVMRNRTLFTNDLELEFTETDPYQAVAATIRLQNNDSAHTIFVQLEPVARFYDPYNPVFTGFHEGFSSKKDMLKALHTHIQGYHSAARPFALHFNEIIVRGYTIDCPDLRNHAELARAGGIPLQE